MTPPLLRFRPTTILTRGGGCAGDDAYGVVGELGHVGEEGHQEPQAGEVGQPIVEQVGRHLLLRPPVPGAEMCQSSWLSLYQWPIELQTKVREDFTIMEQRSPLLDKAKIITDGRFG